MEVFIMDLLRKSIMLSPLIKREIFKEVKWCHYQIPSNYREILENAQMVNTISDDGHKL